MFYNFHFETISSQQLQNKAALHTFCLFVAISVGKPAIAVICGTIFFTCSAAARLSADESNVLRLKLTIAS